MMTDSVDPLLTDQTNLIPTVMHSSNTDLRIDCLFLIDNITFYQVKNFQRKLLTRIFVLCISLVNMNYLYILLLLINESI